MTLAEALQIAAKRLETAGVEGALRDARWLLAHALNEDPSALMAHSDRVLSAKNEAAFESALSAREARQPVSQIIGRREFWGRDFRVTRDVLDPRADTETLIEVALSEPCETILDLGTGSGAILVTLLAECPHARGLGTDISQAALDIARENAKRHGVVGRANFQQADWFKGIEGQFDLIVSNPPYIAATEIGDLQPEVRLWEPEQALTDHADGLSAYREIAAAACSRLAPKGRLIVEIGVGQGAAVVELFRDCGVVEVKIHTDLEGRDRVVSARTP